MNSEVIKVKGYYIGNINDCGSHHTDKEISLELFANSISILIDGQVLSLNDLTIQSILELYNKRKIKWKQSQRKK